MTDQQKSDREKAKQAWEEKGEDLFFNNKILSSSAFLKGISDFKSSLKRDIEKRIDKLEELKRKRPDSINPHRIDELEYILELIETVEP